MTVLCKSPRRRTLLLAALGGAGAGALAARGARALPALPAAAQAARAGYRITPHIGNYYRTARL